MCQGMRSSVFTDACRLRRLVLAVSYHDLFNPFRFGDGRLFGSLDRGLVGSTESDEIMARVRSR